MLARFRLRSLFCEAAGNRCTWFLVAFSKMIRKVERRYAPGTFILETTYSQSTGAVATVTDFMTIRKKHSCLVRIVRGIKGHSRMTTLFSPRFDYGAGDPRITAKLKGLLEVSSRAHTV